MGEIADYYDNLVDKYGYSYQAVDAGSKESLLARYEVLSEVCDMTGKSVLEVGCGFGDLGRYLRKKYDSVIYTGIDISPKMIEQANKIDPYLVTLEMDVNKYSEDIVEIIDVVLAQGIFYKLGENAEEKTKDIILKMFRLAKEAIAFTTIYSCGCDNCTCDTEEYRPKFSELSDFCHSLSDRVLIRMNHHPGDMCVYMYK